MKPLIAASSIVDAINIRGVDEGKPVTRFQLSHKSLSLMCDRAVITHSYMEDLSSELLELGWCCFQVTSSSYGFLKLTTAQNFRRLNGETLLQFLNGDENGKA